MNDLFFMQQALQLARQALAKGEFPVGCVLVHQNQIVARGARHGTLGSCPNERDHAEMIALRNLPANDDHCRQTTLYCTMEPCLMCFAALILNGVKRIVYAYEDVMGGGASCDLSQLTPLYRDSKMAVVPHVLRDESLRLFQAYFRDPRNGYWKNSLLADYTLAQTDPASHTQAKG